MSNQSACPEGYILIECSFDNGPLGVSLKWRANDGMVYVAALLPNSQSAGTYYSISYIHNVQALSNLYICITYFNR